MTTKPNRHHIRFLVCQLSLDARCQTDDSQMFCSSYELAHGRISGGFQVVSKRLERDPRKRFEASAVQSNYVGVCPTVDCSAIDGP